VSCRHFGFSLLLLRNNKSITSRGEGAAAPSISGKVCSPRINFSPDRSCLNDRLYQL
jgi:hypothetical protein